MIITIDGPSGTGKTTIAQRLAKDLHFDYFDTGAMYRTAAYSIILEHVDSHDPKALESFLKNFDFSIESEGHRKRYKVGGNDVTDKIRTSEIAMKASEISALPAVRQRLILWQRSYAKGKKIVCEGRDMGTVVFPDAECKFFLTARPEVRAKRRFLELPPGSSEEQVLAEINQRDHADQTRSLSPLKQAADAYLIDTSDRTVEDIIQTMIQVITL